ncbi:Metallo-dependent phosphatase-like protein [Lentinula aff. lateritia]|uniref:Metallo-dependent phosphatase-like protein n=1 Tax=Lentinula aff. lateritia TaxID=2804960 RepID=A0ACC1TKC0_9AGAR|nr:Metallo-dependent phosphatase-like protein [Lentinula aff. lateritia]
MHLSAALLSVALLLALRVTVNACSDEHAHDHSHAHQKRLFPQTQLTKPTRPLEWGDLNIIHTTDTHGWLLGHQHASFPEPNYSGDLGDFASFVQHMKQLAIEKDVDLLLVDSGDLHDGTGLSDGFPAGGIDAHDPTHLDSPYLTAFYPSHELYDYINTWDMYTNFVPALDGKYLSSNVNITVFDANNNTIDVPVGNRFRKFTTRKGRKITSLGVLYDFTGNDVNTTVQSVADMVKEQWFSEAIAEEPDVFLLVGHMPVSRDNWPTVFNAVRAVHAETPIIILGGHSHIRDCNQPDGRSMALESGRYMETIGWLSANLGSSSDVNAKNNISFSRRYLDQNRVTYEYHSQQSNNSFDTKEGQNITQGLLNLGVKYDLSMLFGIAPQDFTISRDPYPSNGSSLTLFINEAAPYSLTLNNTRANITNIMITNSGSQRFDIYSGTFDKNDQISASPFTDAFMFIKDLPLGVAQEVLPALNAAGADERRKRDLGSVLQERESQMWKRGYVNMRYMEWLDEMDRRHDGAVKRASQNLKLGYVTSDSCPGVGDDTIHAPLASFDIPDFIGSDTPSLSNDSLVDLVFVDFIQEQLLEILNEVQNATTYTDSDVASYTDVLSNAVLGLYAQHAWN